MKRFLSPAALLTLLAFFVSPLPSRAQDAPPPDAGPPGAPGDDQDVSFQTFYDQLGDQDGSWIQTDDYGYVFQPAVEDTNWAPYTDGHWVYSDEGWTWVSDEPWGWATYHYGRWADIDGTGWVWIPGSQWAPAWVSWRYGGGYVGWAPLPPEARFGGGDDHFGSDVDSSYHIGAGWYHFVPVGRVGDPDLRGAYINRRQNFSVIHNTKNITNISVGHNQGGRGGFGGIAANGPPINEINAHATHRVPTVQLNMASGPGRSNVQGNTLLIYAPKVNASTAKQGRPAAVARTIAHPSFNHGQSAAKPAAAHTAERAPAAGGNAAAPPAYHPTEAVHPATSVAPQNTQTFHPQEKPATGIAPENQVHQEKPRPEPKPMENTQAPAQVHHEEERAPALRPEGNAPEQVHHEEQHSAPPSAPHPSAPKPQAPANKPGGGPQDKKPGQ